MAMFLAFLLGMGNFAAQRAVLESRHPMLGMMSPGLFLMARAASLALEFALLLAAMLAVERGEPEWLWLYAAYSLANGLAARAIVRNAN